MFIGLHLRKFQLQVIVVGVNLMTLFEHVIDAIKQINFFKRKEKNNFSWFHFTMV